ncbi:cytochrome ubiquinol oxidase subunit I [bacterium]|nr:cytochrome ubiquinol oxidase subunit I [bacterium]
MSYPWWHVPFLTAPMLIALIATVHVLVSHYAVGGGLFLAVETSHAYRHKDERYLAYLKQHAWFFVLLTVVFGAITGVGIWWIIGLASPLATHFLIQTFVFGWATEWVFFVIELTAGFAFYYFWGRLDPKTHVAMGWIYAIAAWISLVLITGITAFMLDPGRWPETHNFWDGFFNPQFLPQVLARTGGAFLLASLYVYFHASFRCRDREHLRYIERRSSRPAMLGSILVAVGGLWWFLMLPESSKAALQGAAVINVLMVIMFTLTIVVFALLYLGPYRNPGWLSPGFAIMFLGFGLAATATGEYIREAVRKPYIVYNLVLGNQVLVEDVPRLRSEGFIEGTTWPSAWLAARHPQLTQRDSEGRLRIDEQALLGLPAEERVDIGEVLFMYHCNDCHAAENGVNAMAHLLTGWNREMVATSVRHPEQLKYFMPPWSGTEAEAELLTDYLMQLRPELPPGMDFGEGPGQPLSMLPGNDNASEEVR